MGEFIIVLILIVVLVAVFFCYGLIKMCLLVYEKDRAKRHQAQDVENAPGDDYAIPNEPIRVVLARDEEAAGIASETSKVTPPAYGLWRESVRVDPDRLFWQRNDSSVEEEGERPQTSTSRRPPSYLSDDGVSYVVDAVPRSVAPSSPSLAPHPSDVGGVTGARPPW
ncbi:hypothetical protein ACO1O0_006082 [Amphichorda felina]